MGISAARRVQIAAETTRFTAMTTGQRRLVGTNPRLRFVPTMEEISGQVGAIVGPTQLFLTERAGEGSLESAFLRDLEGIIPMWFGMHTRTSVAATAPATGFVYTFTQATENFNINTPTMTMEYGDNAAVYRGVGGICKSWTLTGATSNALRLDSDWDFADVIQGTSFSTLAAGAYGAYDRKPPILLTNDSLLRIGGTLVGADLVSFAFTYNTGLSLAARVDGTLQKDDLVIDIPSIEFSTVLRTGTHQRGQFTAFEQNTVQSFELSNAADTFSIKWTGQVSEVGDVDDNDGTSTMAVTVRGVPAASLLPDPINVRINTTAQSLGAA